MLLIEGDAKGSVNPASLSANATQGDAWIDPGQGDFTVHMQMNSQGVQAANLAFNSKDYSFAQTIAKYAAGEPGFCQLCAIAKTASADPGVDKATEYAALEALTGKQISSSFLEYPKLRDLFPIPSLIGGGNVRIKLAGKFSNSKFSVGAGEVVLNGTGSITWEFTVPVLDLTNVTDDSCAGTDGSSLYNCACDNGSCSPCANDAYPYMYDAANNVCVDVS